MLSENNKRAQQIRAQIEELKKTDASKSRYRLQGIHRQGDFVKDQRSSGLSKEILLAVHLRAQQTAGESYDQVFEDLLHSVLGQDEEAVRAILGDTDPETAVLWSTSLAEVLKPLSS